MLAWFPWRTWADKPKGSEMVEQRKQEPFAGLWGGWLARRIHFSLMHKLSLMFQMDFTVWLHGDSEDQNHQKWVKNRSPCSWSGSPHSQPGLQIFLGFGFSAPSICLYWAASGFHRAVGSVSPLLWAANVQEQLLGELRLLHAWQPVLGLDGVGCHWWLPSWTDTLN